MEKSLDELIEFLVGEIAGCGAKGATLHQIIDIVKSFCNITCPEVPIRGSPSPWTPFTNTDPAGPQKVDQDFILRLWNWLGRHPDVSIGHKAQFSNTPLNQFWPKSEDAEATLSQCSTRAPRVFVNEDRIYQAICGHAPESGRLHAKELELLSTIASAGRDGILQGELGRIANQDKRSVPKRTDGLHDKGYIVKESVYTKGLKTSRLTLKKYASGRDATRDADRTRGKKSKPQIAEFRVRDLADKISTHLTDETLLDLDILLERIEMSSGGKKKAALKVLRCMERAGCLKRVRTAFGPAAQASDLKTCMQSVRPLTAGDSEIFEKADLPFGKSLSELVAELNEALSPASEPDVGKPETEETSVAMAQWNPDRCLANVLSDAAQVAGETGLSHIASQNMITGPLFRRPIGSMLTRLSYQGLLSQPDHLHHLGIVQATKLVDGSLEHAHFSMEVLPKVFRDKSVNSAAIPGKKLLEKTQHTEGATATGVDSADAQGFDEFGLPKLAYFGFTLRRGNKSLTELIESTRASNIPPRQGEPVLIQDSLGKDILDSVVDESVPKQKILRKKKKRRETVLSTKGKNVENKIQSTNGKNNENKIQSTNGKNDESKTKGRPRKFLRGTEKFWRYHFLQARVKLLGEGETLKSSSGIMDHAAGLAVFDIRPTGFDEAVAAAITAGLPVPAIPKHITDEWVSQIQTVLARKETGGYVTPAGVIVGSVRYWSQMLIVKSSRLNTLNFARAPGFRFITSSVAHSLGHLRPKPTSRRTKRARVMENVRNSNKRSRRTGPTLGVFRDPSMVPNHPTSTSQPSPIPLTSLEYRQLMEDTDPDSGLDQASFSRSTPSSQKDGRTSIGTSVSPSRTAEPKSRAISRTSRIDDTAPTPTPLPRLLRKRMPSRRVVESLLDGEDDLGSVSNGFSSSSPRRAGRWTHQRSGSARDEVALSLEDPSGPQEHHMAPEPPTNISAGDLDTPSSQVEIPTPSHQSEFAQAVEQDLPSTAPDAPEGTPAPHQAEDEIVVPLHNAPDDSDLQQVAEERAADNQHTQPAEDVINNPGTSVIPPSILASPQGPNTTEVDLIDTRPSLPPKPVKPIRPGQTQSSKLCRKILLDLVMLVSGAAPYEPLTFKRVMVNRWEASGGHGRGDRDLVKNGLRSLVLNGKLRSISFSFRDTRGRLCYKAIVAHPAVDPTGQLVQNLKTKMIAAGQLEYVPPEWQAETLPSLNFSGRRPMLKEHLERPPIQEIPRLFEGHSEEEDLSDEAPPMTPSRRRSAARRRTQRRMSTPDSVSSSPTPSVSSRVSSQDSQGDSPVHGAFLTLKLPRLGELPQVRLFNATLKEPQWMSEVRSNPPVKQHLSYTRIAPAPLRSNTQAVSLQSTTLSNPLEKRRSGLRRKAKDGHFDHVTHERLLGRAAPALPQSLASIVESQEAYDQSWKIDNGEDEAAKAFNEYALVEAWEIRNQQALLGKAVQYTFINHTIPRVRLAPSIAKIWLHVNFLGNYIITEHPNFEADSWPPFVSALQDAEVVEVSSPTDSVENEASTLSQSPQPATRKVTRVRRKRKLSLTPEASTPSRPSKRRKAVSTRPSKDRPDGSRIPMLGSEESTPVNDNPGHARASIILATLSAEDLYRMAVTIICVQTLAGGLQKDVDWSIVQELLPGHQGAEVLTDCWTVMQKKYSTDTRSLTTSLQEKYLDAFEHGNVRGLDFNNPTVAMWKDIISWAVCELDPDASSRKKFILSNDRSCAIESLNINPTGRKASVSTLFIPDVKRSKVYREGLYASTIFGSSVQRELTHDNPPPIDTLSAVRSLLLSIILCPEDRYSQPAANEKWSSMAPSEEDREKAARPAFRSLEEARFIVRRTESRQSIGARKYVATARFFEQFNETNCFITADTLRNAARYKFEVLDQSFRRADNVEIPQTTRLDAGPTLALMQLLNTRYITLKPGADIPNSRYGVACERVGYQHSSLQNDDFAFSVIVAKQEGYIFGLTSSSEPPTSTPDIPAGDPDRWDQTPLWADVHGGVVLEVWEMVLASVVGIVSLRPGIASAEINSMLGGAVTAWEVTIVLLWAEKARLVKKTLSADDAWQTLPEWWLCLSPGSGAEEAGAGREDGMIHED